MAESAESTTLKTALSELNSEIPHQLTGDKEIEEIDVLTGRDIVFSLLCNSSLYGAPLFQFLEQHGQLYRYRNAREQETSKLLCVAEDILRPPLEYKVQELRRIRKSLQTLRSNEDDASTISWFFKNLSYENIETTTFREAQLRIDPDPKRYCKGKIPRLNPHVLMMNEAKHPDPTLHDYKRELTKLIKTLESHRENSTLMFLLLDDSPYAISADYEAQTHFTTMTMILTENEQTYVQSQLNFHDDEEFEANVPKSSIDLIQRTSPNRFTSGLNFGSQGYKVPDRLTDLDWIHTEVTDELVNSLTTVPQIPRDTRHPEDKLTPQTEEMVTRRHRRLKSDPVRPEVILLSPPLTPLKSVNDTQRQTSTTRQPDNPVTTKPVIRGREQEFLYKQQQQRSTTAPMKKSKGTEMPKIVQTKSINLDEIESDSIPTDTQIFEYQISGDSTSQMLSNMLIRIATHLQRRGATASYLETLPSHTERFGTSSRYATQLVRDELLQGDELILLCDSTSSIRYLVTVSNTKHIVYLNRVLYYRWNRWS
jgi:hypothetical protein